MPPEYYSWYRMKQTNTDIYFLANVTQKYIKKNIKVVTNPQERKNQLLDEKCMWKKNIIYFCCFLAHTPSEWAHRKSVGKDVIFFSVLLLLLLPFAFSLYIFFLPISYVYYSFMFRELLSTREKMKEIKGKWNEKKKFHILTDGKFSQNKRERNWKNVGR